MATVKIQGPDGNTYEVPYDEGASDADILAKAKQMHSAGQLKPIVIAPTNPSTEFAAGMGKALATGVAKGAASMAGMPRELAEAGQSVVNYNLPESVRSMPTTGMAEEYLGRPFGGLHKAEGLPEKIAESVGTMAPGAIFPGQSALARFMGPLLSGAGSELAGEAAQQYTPSLEGAARVAGAIASPMAARKLALGTSAAQRAKEITGMAGKPRKYVGQDWFAANIPALKNEINVLEARNAMAPGAASAMAGPGGSLHQILNDYSKYSKEVTDPLKLAAGRINSELARNGGVLDGSMYQNLRSIIGDEAFGASGKAKTGLYKIQDALDSAMEQSIMATNPADLGRFQDWRRKYRNMEVLKHAAIADKEGLAKGRLSEKSLANAAAQIYGDEAFLQGKDPFSRAALANYGTTAKERGTFTEGLGGILGALAGGLTGTGGAERSVLGLLTGEAAGKMLRGLKAPIRGAFSGSPSDYAQILLRSREATTQQPGK